MILVDVSKLLDRLEEFNTDDPIGYALYRFAKDRILEADTEVNLVRCGECECYGEAGEYNDAYCKRGLLVQPRKSDYCSFGMTRTVETPATVENFGLLLKRLGWEGGKHGFEERDKSAD